MQPDVAAGVADGLRALSAAEASTRGPRLDALTPRALRRCLALAEGASDALSHARRLLCREHAAQAPGATVAGARSESVGDSGSDFAFPASDGDDAPLLSRPARQAAPQLLLPSAAAARLLARLGCAPADGSEGQRTGLDAGLARVDELAARSTALAALVTARLLHLLAGPGAPTSPAPRGSGVSTAAAPAAAAAASAGVPLAFRPRLSVITNPGGIGGASLHGPFPLGSPALAAVGAFNAGFAAATAAAAGGDDDDLTPPRVSHAPHSALDVPSGHDEAPAAWLNAMSPRSILASTSAVFHAPKHSPGGLTRTLPPAAAGAPRHGAAHAGSASRHADTSSGPAAALPQLPTLTAPLSQSSSDAQGAADLAPRLHETIYLQPYDPSLPQSPQQALRMLATAAPQDSQVRRFVSALRAAITRGTLERLIGDGTLAHALEDGTFDQLLPPGATADFDEDEDEDEEDGDEDDSAGVAAGLEVPREPALAPHSDGVEAGDAAIDTSPDRDSFTGLVAGGLAASPLSQLQQAPITPPTAPALVRQGSAFKLSVSSNVSCNDAAAEAGDGGGTPNDGDSLAAAMFILSLGPEFDVEGFLSDLSHLRQLKHPSVAVGSGDAATNDTSSSGRQLQVGGVLTGGSHAHGALNDNDSLSEGYDTEWSAGGLGRGRNPSSVAKSGAINPDVAAAPPSREHVAARRPVVPPLGGMRMVRQGTIGGSENDGLAALTAAAAASFATIVDSDEDGADDEEEDETTTRDDASTRFAPAGEGAPAAVGVHTARIGLRTLTEEGAEDGGSTIAGSAGGGALSALNTERRSSVYSGALPPGAGGGLGSGLSSRRGSMLLLPGGVGSQRGTARSSLDSGGATSDGWSGGANRTASEILTSTRSLARAGRTRHRQGSRRSSISSSGSTASGSFVVADAGSSMLVVEEAPDEALGSPTSAAVVAAAGPRPGAGAGVGAGAHDEQLPLFSAVSAGLGAASTALGSEAGDTASGVAGGGASSLPAVHRARLARLAKLQLLVGAPQRGRGDSHADDPSGDAAESASLVDELTALAGSLKASSQAVHERLRSDNASLDALGDAVEVNLAAIGAANEQLSDARARAGLRSLCEAFGLLASGAILFIIAYLVIRLLPSPPPPAAATAASVLTTALASLRPAPLTPLPPPTAVGATEAPPLPSAGAALFAGSPSAPGEPVGAVDHAAFERAASPAAVEQAFVDARGDAQPVFEGGV